MESLSIWIDNVNLRSKLTRFIFGVVIIDIAIFLIELALLPFQPGMYPVFIVSSIALFFYLLPLTIFLVYKKLYIVYFFYLLHLFLFVIFLISIIVGIVFANSGLLFIAIMYIFGLFITSISSYGLGFLYILQALLWIFLIPIFLFPLINYPKKSVKKLFYPFTRLNIAECIGFSTSFFFYLPIIIFMYSFYIVWLIPESSEFWNSWIFN